MTYTCMTVRQKFGEFLNEVQYRQGKVLITKAGKPVAALVDVALFEKIRDLDEEFERLRGSLAKAFANVRVAKGEALVDEAVHAARKKRSARGHESRVGYQRPGIRVDVSSERSRASRGRVAGRAV